MEMDKDLSVVRKALKKTGAQYLFIDHNLEHAFPNSFASAVLAGQVPQWLSIVKIPEKYSGHSVFKIDKNLLAQEMKLAEGEKSTLEKK